MFVMDWVALSLDLTFKNDLVELVASCSFSIIEYQFNPCFLNVVITLAFIGYMGWVNTFVTYA